MKWWPFKRKRPVVTRIYFPPATAEEAEAFRAEQAEQLRLDLLREGRTFLCAWSNVAWGTPGAALYALAYDGLMTQRNGPPREPSEGYRVWFEITDKGRKYLAEHEFV